MTDSALASTRKSTLTWTLAALALVLAGCQLGPRPLRESTAMPSGEWAVTAIRWGNVKVRDSGAVIARFGQVIRFEPGLAVSGGETCADPVYLASAIVADRYLHAEFGLRAADFGLHRWQDVRVTEVFCKGQRWRALGGEVFWIDYDRGYAVREDVLYELRRRKPAA
jgi:hypothetical protein